MVGLVALLAASALCAVYLIVIAVEVAVDRPVWGLVAVAVGSVVLFVVLLGLVNAGSW